MERFAPAADDGVPADQVWGVTTRRWAIGGICRALRIDRRLTNPQTNANLTTIRRALEHASRRDSRHPTRGMVRQACRELIAMARDKGTADLRNPMAAWTAQAIARYGAWTETGSPVGESVGAACSRDNPATPPEGVHDEVTR
jgi:hypothetical protein